MCLEDPFDLKHNLGSGVSTRSKYTFLCKLVVIAVFIHILKTIRKSREIFMNKIEVGDMEFVEHGVSSSFEMAF